MRCIAHAIFSIFWKTDTENQPAAEQPIAAKQPAAEKPPAAPKLPAVVNDHYDHFNRVDQLLSDMPEVLEIVHKDIVAGLCKETVKSREATFTTENLLRAIVLMQSEGWTLRETTIRIADSLFFQNFCRLFKKSTIDHTLLSNAYNAISPESWERINQLFGVKMKKEGNIDTDTIRTDTTVTESNIHYPTDVSLLWDVYRTIERLTSLAREAGAPLTFIRFHLKKIKKLYLDVTRFGNSTNKKRLRMVKQKLALLIKRVAEGVEKAKRISTELSLLLTPILQSLGQQLLEFIPIMEQIVNVAQRNMAGEKVPVADKVFSLFEPHTELIIRGRREKPVEFGHKVLFSETKEKFITDYVVFEKCPSDTTLLPVVMERHEKIFGDKIKKLAADMGFRPSEVDFKELEKKLDYLAVPQRLRDMSNPLLSLYQCFRAGIEGTISCLKRAYRLSRCFFRGFNGFCRTIGSAVFCHNLSTIATLLKEKEKLLKKKAKT